MVFQTKRTSYYRPLPLKQRTSSQDTRRDYSHNTWISLLVLLKLRELFVTVDNFSIWRRHLAWAMENGTDLRAYMTQRYGSSMVFMSLLLSTELGVLFNSAGVTATVRLQLQEGNHKTVSFWAGFMIIVSALLTLLSLISTFTAWAMVNSVDEANAHCIFRSSIGQYAAELPGRLIVCSIYSFLISFMLFFFLLLPVGPWSIVLLGCTVFLFIHIVSCFSAFGRVIMHTGAMGKSRIFTPEYEEFLLPHSLHSNLLVKAQANLANNTSIIRQYRRKQKPIDRHLTEADMYDHLCGRLDAMSGISNNNNIPYRPRADSTVRFADQEILEVVGAGGRAGHPPPPPLNSNSNSNGYGSASRHHRNLTPLSDVSSTLERQTPPSTVASSTRKTSSSLLARPQHPSMSSRPRPPLPSPLSMEPMRTTSTVSTNSLEQWLLQASPLTADGQKESVDVSFRSNQNHGDPLAMLSPPPSRGVVTPIPLSGTTGRSITTRSAPPIRKSSRMSDVTMDDRDLSEDERFALDYGDIEDHHNEEDEDDDDDDDGMLLSPQNSNNSSNNNSSNSNRNNISHDYTSGYDKLDESEGEQTSLLNGNQYLQGDNNSNNNYYSSSNGPRNLKKPPPL